MAEETFYDRIHQWIKEEFKDVKIINDERNPGTVIEFNYSQGKMAIGFNNDDQKKCLIVRGINIDQPHRQALANLDPTLRKQLRYDFSYEFASYNIPYNVKYSDDDILHTIQFTKPYYNHNIDKNELMDKIFEVFNAGFRVIAFVNKELN